MAIKEEFTAYARECEQEFRDLLCALTVIPAPSWHEERRAAFVLNWFRENGMEGAYIDDAQNVILPVGNTATGDLAIYMAHTDTVFPEETPLAVTEKDGLLYCPGIGDDAVRLVTLLLTARFFVKNGYTPKTGILFVANSGEEAKGDLRGTREIMKNFGSRVKEFFTFDGNLGALCDNAIGAQRYKVTVHTEGGHSYADFGNRNAICIAGSIIQALYTVKVPKPTNKCVTTYNVGGITGGTSVNTIPSECEFLYEYRSTHREHLDAMKNMFEKVIDAYRATGVKIDVEMIGERPCSRAVDAAALDVLAARASAAYDEIGHEWGRGAASTDASLPLSMGIPAICVGAGESGNAHRPDEWTDPAAFVPGMQFALMLIAASFEEK